MLAESGEPGVSRLSPMRCGQKERHIPRAQNVGKFTDWLADDSV
jgi:hypothetical protein